MKIVQFQETEDYVICLCDDGKLYISEWCKVNKEIRLKPYVDPVLVEDTNND